MKKMISAIWDLFFQNFRNGFLKHIKFAYENNEVKPGKLSGVHGLGVFLAVYKHKAPQLMLAKHSYRFTAKLVHFLLRHKLAP